MAVGGGGVEALFYRGPITPGDVASWESPGVLVDGGAGGGSGGLPESIFLSSNAIQHNAGIGASIGTLSVVNGTGSYILSLAYNPGSLFTVVGTTLEVAADISADDGMNPIVVKATNGGISPTFFYGIVVFVFPPIVAGYVPTYYIYGF
jgi:hypothetical protein